MFACSAGAPIGETKSSSISINDKESYGQSQSSKFEEKCKNGNCKFKFDKDESLQKDKDLDVNTHSEKRDRGYDFELHNDRKENTDFTGSFWQDSKTEAGKTEVDFHAQKGSDEDIKVSKNEGNGKKKSSFDYDGQHYKDSHLDVQKTINTFSRPPFPPSSRLRGRSFYDKMSAAIAAIKGKRDHLKRDQKDVVYHEDGTSSDQKHRSGQGYSTGDTPPKGQKPNSKAIDEHIDTQHFDEKHVSLDAQKKAPAKPALERRDVRKTAEYKEDQQNYATSHVNVKSQEDEKEKSTDLKVDGNKDRWGEKKISFEGEETKDGI